MARRRCCPCRSRRPRRSSTTRRRSRTAGGPARPARSSCAGRRCRDVVVDEGATVDEGRAQDGPAAAGEHRSPCWPRRRSMVGQLRGRCARRYGRCRLRLTALRCPEEAGRTGLRRAPSKARAPPGWGSRPVSLETKLESRTTSWQVSAKIAPPSSPLFEGALLEDVGTALEPEGSAGPAAAIRGEVAVGGDHDAVGRAAPPAARRAGRALLEPDEALRAQMPPPEFWALACPGR